MTLRFDPAVAQYIWDGGYTNRHLPKGAGMRWNPALRHWWTDSDERAAKLIEFADPATAARLRPNATAHADALTASRASSADVTISAPDGYTYRDFQLAGITFALNRDATLIADEMGLGKTIQAIGLINADPTITRCLIICPASLRLNWERELQRWLTRKLSIGIATTKDWPDTDIVIVNYDIAWRAGVAGPINAETWDLVCLDESHYVKNPDAKRTRAIVGQPRSKRGGAAHPGIRARRKLALTGTPITNRPKELFSTLHWLAPTAWPNFFGFAKRYCNAHKISIGRGRTAWDVGGASHLDELQDRLRSTIMVRRLKADVLTELPAKVRQVIEVPANGASSVVKAERDAWAVQERTLGPLRAQVERAKGGTEAEYRDAVQRLTAAENIAFSEMSAARHDTAVAKIPAVLAHIVDALEASDDAKVVVMAHHHDVVDALLDGLTGQLTTEGPYHPVSLTGRTPLADRQAAVDRFQDDPECRVFVGSITAAGVGITLTASSHVVFAELDWVPGNVSQAEDRCHRIGQQDSVLVQHLVIDGTLDARMAHTIVKKQKVIDAALDTKPTPTVLVAESPKKQQVALQADRLLPEDVAAIHAALQRLSGMCDGARHLDSAGFNKHDTDIGKSLGNVQALTAKQAVLGLRIVRKYRRQLDSAMVDALTAAADRIRKEG